MATSSFLPRVWAACRSAAIVTAAASCTLLAAADADPEARFRGAGQADPIRVTNSRVTDGAIAFDIAWDHSWRASWQAAAEETGAAAPLPLENWDAAWVFVKFRRPDGDGWSHATLAPAAADHRVPAGARCDVGLDNDGRRGVGAFIYRAAPGQGAIEWKQIALRWQHEADGVADPAAVPIRVYAISMVYVPRCGFWAGDGGTRTPAAQFSAGMTEAPLRITSEDALTIGGEAAENLGNRDGLGLFEFEDFSSRGPKPLPAEFPKGVAAFYCMRHEVTQGEYVAFLNALSFKQQAQVTGLMEINQPGDPAAAAGTAIQQASVENRRGIVIATSGTAGSPATPAIYETATPHLPCPGIGTHTDLIAYTGWTGLRPMTELEFEKACRGPLRPVPGEFAWGTDQIAGTLPAAAPNGYAVREPGTAQEQAIWQGADGPDATRGNAVWQGAVPMPEPGKPADAAAKPIAGPFRAGIFATPTSGRVAAGASYWGILDLSGSLWELTVGVGNGAGRRYAGTHGDGILIEPADRKDLLSRAVVPSGTGSAFKRRGGGFTGGYAGNLSTSDRWDVCINWDGRGLFGVHGFRAVRSAPAASVTKR